MKFWWNLRVNTWIYQFKTRKIKIKMLWEKGSNSSWDKSKGTCSTAVYLSTWLKSGLKQLITLLQTAIKSNHTCRHHQSKCLKRNLKIKERIFLDFYSKIVSSISANLTNPWDPADLLICGVFSLYLSPYSNSTHLIHRGKLHTGFDEDMHFYDI